MTQLQSPDSVDPPRLANFTEVGSPYYGGDGPLTVSMHELDDRSTRSRPRKTIQVLVERPSPAKGIVGTTTVPGNSRPPRRAPRAGLKKNKAQRTIFAEQQVQKHVLPPIHDETIAITESAEKPTCSLNLTCYRSGRHGCLRRQIQVARTPAAPNPNGDVLVTDDQEFFRAVSREYEQHLCGFWRRCTTLKTLKRIRLLSYTPSSRPQVVPLDDFTLQEIFYAYQNPNSVEPDQEWIDWVFRLRQPDRRHALEFVEDWSGFRIGLVGSIPWVAATVVGVTWVAKGGDTQTAFTVAAFILTVGTTWLALLAIISKAES